jgi:DNA helicase-2/ATP-dependent DNA helicase PcrA
MIQYLQLNLRDQGVFDCLLKFPKLKKYQKRTLREIRDTFEELKTLKPVEIIDTIKYDLNYLNHINEFAQLSNNNYDHLKEKLSILQALARGIETPFEFLNRLDTLEQFIKNHENDGSNTIYLSTMHSAKGLEFKNVKIIDVYDKILPQQKSTIEEDRRLLYVALSRAKERLEVLTCQFRNGKLNAKKQFINELKDNPTVDLVTYKEEKESSATFAAGDRVTHDHFGQGTIVSIDEATIKIEFEDSIRNLSKDVCYAKELIQKLDLS